MDAEEWAASLVVGNQHHLGKPLHLHLRNAYLRSGDDITWWTSTMVVLRHLQLLWARSTRSKIFQQDVGIVDDIEAVVVIAGAMKIL